MKELALHNPDTLAPPPSRYSHVVEVPEGMRLAYVSGQVAVRPDGTAVEGFADQCRQVLDNVAAALAAVDMAISDIVRINTYITDAREIATFREIRDRWAGGHAAASTLVVVAALASPDWQVEVEVVAAKAKP